MAAGVTCESESARERVRERMKKGLLKSHGPEIAWLVGPVLFSGPMTIDKMCCYLCFCFGPVSDGFYGRNSIQASASREINLSINIKIEKL
jgi:hypothetical protein